LETPAPSPRPAPPSRTAAGPLALAYMALIAYASLYPFGEWRDQGIVPWAFLWAPLPRWWTGFDVTANVLGYGPLGFLLALAALRSGRGGVRVNKAGCLDRCAGGPVAVVYPEGVWYSFVDASDIDEIVESHLKNGQPVERLRLPPDVGR
jgi:(2Fe-2S) ferredoxin